MASNSILISRSSERIWVDLISRSITQELQIDIPTSPSIFLVPSSISSQNPQSFVPRNTGIGPYHHLNQELYQTEPRKLAAVREFLRPYQIPDIPHLLVSKLKAIEPAIRGCYQKYLDLDGETLCWILAIDGLCLLRHLFSYFNAAEDGEIGYSAVDFAVLECQIPAVVMETIRTAVKRPDTDEYFASSREIDLASSPSPAAMYDSIVFRGYNAFCCRHSPLQPMDFDLFCSSQSGETSQTTHHLLDFMYHSILNNRGKRASSLLSIDFEFEGSPLENVETMVNVAAGLGNAHALRLKQHLSFLKLLWEKLQSVVVFKKSETRKAKLEEIDIPSASELSKTAKVKFEATEGGIRDVKFDEERLVFRLPRIDLNESSEVVIRNLLAYEALASPAGSNSELAEYFDLMCGIVDGEEDVRLLREAAVVGGELSDDRVAGMFNGFGKSGGRKGKKKVGIEGAIERVNEVYGRRIWIRVRKGMEKMGRECRDCGKGLWKVLAYVSTVVVVLVMVLQSFCQVYGCSNHHLFGGIRPSWFAL